MTRTFQLLIALLSTLSLFGAGHEVSAVRYAPSDTLFAGSPTGTGSFSSAASSGSAIEITLDKSPYAPSTVIATVDGNGIAPRPATPLAMTLVRQSEPAVTGNGSGFITAWTEQSAGFRGVTAGRVSDEGAALDGSGIPLGLNSYASPVIAHSSTEALVVWSTMDSVVAARLSPLGDVLDTAPISLGTVRTNAIAVAWNGSRYFVIWTDGDKLFGAFVGPDGVATAPRAIGNQTAPLNFASGLDMAWDGRQFIVVFGEVSYQGNECGECVLSPDHVRLLRVSATGDAIDVVPVRIPGVHLHAAVASSGTESLIALDSESDTSTMIVHDDGGVLVLGPEVPLFHWFLSIGSDVAWTGSAYVVGWRYTPSSSAAGWIGVSRVNQSGVSFASFFTPAAGAPDFVTQSAVPSVAANDAGDPAVVISEMAPPSYVSRARLYLMSEMASTPAPPPAPRNVISVYGGGTTLIEWQSDGTPDGFLLEISPDFGKTWFPIVVTTDVRSRTIQQVQVGTQIRVSAFGPGGLSAGTITSVGSPQRRHAQRP